MSNANRKLNINARASRIRYADAVVHVVFSGIWWMLGPLMRTPTHLTVLYSLCFSQCVCFFAFGNWQTLELCLCAYICVVQAMNRYSASASTDDMRRETRRTGITTNTTTTAATINDAIKMKTNKLHRKALYGNTYFGTIEKVCVHWNAVRRFCKQRKKGKEKNNMFKSLMAYETKRSARVPESVWRCSAPRKKKNCNYIKSDGARADLREIERDRAMVGGSSEYALKIEP